MTGFYSFDELHLLLTLLWTNHPCHSTLFFHKPFSLARSTLRRSPPVLHSDTVPALSLYWGQLSPKGSGTFHYQASLSLPLPSGPALIMTSPAQVSC